MLDTMREAVEGLNWMAGKTFLHGTDGPDELQSEVLRRIEALSNEAGNLGSLSKIPSPEAALRELLKGRSEYHQPDVPVALVPYSLERISLPESLVGLPEATDLLPESARQYLQGRELMLREEPPEEQSPPYWDPVLKRNKKHYRQFIQKLHSIGFLQYTQKPKNQVGVFFVHKSDQERIRLIVDARSTNALFKDPPGVELCSSEGFSRIECQLSGKARPGSVEFFSELQSLNLFVGLSDVKDCFHRLRQPRWLAEYFCLMPIKARWVGLEGSSLDGVLLHADSVIYPMPGSLCMGFSWSLYFSQAINEHQCKLVPSRKESPIISDEGEAVVFSSADSRRDPNGSTRHYVYVDNLGILSSHEGVVRNALQELDEHFSRQGLLLHPGEVSQGETKALGTILDGNQLCSRITPERFHKVRQSIRGILRRKKISGRTLEIVIGHATFCALNNRMLLSCFHSCYKFIQACYYSPTALWTSARAELQAFAGMMIFLRSDWWRPWNELVCCSDASTTGFGVCTSFWNIADVAEVGRVQERSRFKRNQSCPARESSLTAAGFVKDSITGSWRSGEIDGEEYLSLTGWSLDNDFPEVPARLLRKELWQPRLWGKWQFDEKIINLEARAAVKALKRVALSRFGSHVRQLFLLDNLSLVLALERCRSRQLDLLKIVRIFCSYCICRGIQPSFRWIPSELNNSDEPSRYDTDEPSKLLTDLIPNGPEDNSGVGFARQRKESSSAQSGESAEARNSCQDSNQANKPEVAGTTSEREACRQKGFAGLSDFARRSSSGGHPCTDLSFKKRQSDLQEFRQQQHCSEVQQEAEEPSDSCQVSATHLCRSTLRGERQVQPQLAREKSCGYGHREDVQEGVSGFYRMGRSNKTTRRPGRESGPTHHRLHEREVLDGSPGLCGRPANSKLDASSPSVQPHWRSPSPSLHPSSCGWRRLCPGRSRTPYPLAVWCGMAALMVEGGHLNMAIFLLVAVSTYARPSELLRLRIFSLIRPAVGITGSWSLLMSPEELQQPSKTGDFDVSVLLDSPYMISWASKIFSAMKETEAEAPLWSFNYSQYLRIFQASAKKLGLPLQPYHTRHQWSVDRQEQEVQVTARGAEERTVEEHKVDSSIRKVCATGQKLGTGEPAIQRLLFDLRGGNRGHHSFKKSPSEFSFPRRSAKGPYVADLFSGNGGVAAACERLGFRSNEWDIRHGHHCDLTRRKVLRRLKVDIKQGKVLAAMLDPPCDSFSAARDRTKVIRTRAQPWGVDESLLTENEKQNVTLGNSCFASCCNLIRVLNLYKVPWILANHVSSKCWQLPFLQHLEQQEHVVSIISDCCQYGTAWQKRQKFLCGNIAPADLHRIDHRCNNSGICSRSDRPHFRLTGKGPNNINWTTIAEPYPKQLCDGLAYSLTCVYHYNTSHY